MLLNREAHSEEPATPTHFKVDLQIEESSAPNQLLLLDFTLFLTGHRKIVLKDHLGTFRLTDKGQESNSADM